MKNISVKSGDNVVVIAGKDKSKTGKVMAASPKLGKVIVEGVNIVSRHSKPRSAQDHGGIIKHEAPIDASNVMVICPKCGKATRVRHQVVDGKNVRVCKCGEVLDKAYTKKADKAEAKKTTAKKQTNAKAQTEAKAEKAPVKKAPAKKAEAKIEATKASKTAAKPAVRKTKKDV